MSSSNDQCSPKLFSWRNLLGISHRSEQNVICLTLDVSYTITGFVLICTQWYHHILYRFVKRVTVLDLSQAFRSTRNRMIRVNYVQRPAECNFFSKTNVTTYFIHVTLISRKSQCFVGRCGLLALKVWPRSRHRLSEPNSRFDLEVF